MQTGLYRIYSLVSDFSHSTFLKFTHSVNVLIFIYFLVALGLCCCAPISLIGVSQSTLLGCVRVSHYGCFSCFGAQALEPPASVVVPQRALVPTFSSCGVGA